MKLFEVFRLSDLNNYQYTTVSKSLARAVYQFSLSDGQNINVVIKTLMSPESSEIHDMLMQYVKQPERLYDPAVAEQIRKKLGGIYYVIFHDADKHENDFEMTNKNRDMFTILGTVAKILIDFANSHKILELSFASESNELSRVKVYDRLSDIIPKYTKLKRLEDDRGEHLVSYFFTGR